MSKDPFATLAIQIEEDVKKYCAAIKDMEIKPEGFTKKYSIQAIKFSVIIEYENGGRFFARLPEKQQILAFGRTAKEAIRNFVILKLDLKI